MTRRPIDLLAVASWYPSRLDPIAGRFVADQLQALAATGLVRPAVVSFEPAELIGGRAVRSRCAALVSDLAARTIRERPGLFLVPAGGSAGQGAAPLIPVARITIPSGRNAAAGALHGAVAREGAMGALADRFEAGRETDVRRPEIVHAHTVYPDGAGAAILAQRLGAPLILTEHASFVDRLISDPSIRARYTATVDAASRLVVVSETLARELVTALPAITPKVSVIPNAISLASFPLVEQRSDRVPEELLFVGYRKATKGIDTLLRAFALVAARRPAARLRLVGSSPTENIERGWHGLAAELGIGASVVFDPPADRAGVRAALGRASLFVHPSPRETFGVVAVEALATGLPVVAADSGGVTEILGPDPDAVGRLVPAGDHQALASAIDDALTRIDSFDPWRLRAAVQGRFDDETVGRQLLELYTDARQTASRRVPEASLSGPSSPGATDKRPVGRRILVALDPARAESVGRLAEPTRASLVLVTATGFPDGRRAGLAGVVEADVQGRIRALADAANLGPPARGAARLVRAIRHPLAVARRRGWLPGLERVVEQRGGAAVDSAIALARKGGSGDVEIICVDGLDHLAAVRALRSGAGTLGHGGLRRLGDEA